MYVYVINFSLHFYPCSLLQISSHALAFEKKKFGHSTHKDEQKMIQPIKHINVHIIIDVH